MPPKKDQKPGKKTEQKKKDKVVEDKTFGLKNKKGATAQKFIANVTKQVQQGGQKRSTTQQDEKLSKKDAQKAKLEELNLLFRPVQETQKVGKGVDPKSLLCAFFKQGSCKKGAKCKFSHDVEVERKAIKRSVYTDEKSEDTMEDWDEEKLEDVVNKKHGESNKSKPKTSIICKYFLDAVENSKYGWFWQCPNGETCHYRHALPAGFILKKDKKKMEDQKEEISLEELIERDRAALSGDLPKLNLEIFLRWKQKKRNEKIAKLQENQDKKKKDFKQGKTFGLSGRDMFTFNPDLVEGDDDEADTTVYRRQPDDDADEAVGEGAAAARPVVEIDLDNLAAMAREIDGTGTVAKAQPPTSNGTTGDEAGRLSEAAGGAPPEAADGTDAAIAAALAATKDSLVLDQVPIDENLFDDLDGIDEDVETLDLDS